jgi:hypothetical protein
MSKLVPPTEPIIYEPSPIQDEAWKYLTDKTTNVVLYGGAAAAGKSDLICVFTTLMCIQYPSIVVGLTRARIIDLKKSTLITLFGVFKRFHLKENTHYTFDRQVNIITFWNGSKIMMFDSALYPSDPLFERLSSIELTFACADECSQLTKTCYDIIQSRIRYKHNDYQLIPKFLMATNPTNNFIKTEIYNPYIEGTLPNHIKVILGKASDNKYIDKSYIENLERSHQTIKERLLYGNWNYSDTDDSIFNPEKLVNIFYNSNFVNVNNKKYITIDPAALGSDKTAISVWEGLDCFKIELHSHKTIPQIYDRVLLLMNQYGVSITNVVVDITGVGTGLGHLLKGCQEFIAGGKATNPVYGNKKDEVYYNFAEYVNDDRIKISYNGYKDEIVQELQSHTMMDYDKESKTRILSKEKVRSLIGRSPDLADCISMIMVFHTGKPQGFTWH